MQHFYEEVNVCHTFLLLILLMVIYGTMMMWSWLYSHPINKHIVWISGATAQ